MQERRQGERDAGKTRAEAGATPPRRKLAARSQRASGIAPASCCSKPQPVFWPREEVLHTKLHAAPHATLSARLHDKRRTQLSLVKPPPKKAKTATLQVRIDEEVRHRLNLYAEFIQSTPSYVVAEALKLLFKRDEEFKRWTGQHTNSNQDSGLQGEESLVDTFKLA